MISHACQERLKSLLEKLACIAEHRIDVIKVSVWNLQDSPLYFYYHAPVGVAIWSIECLGKSR